MLRESLFREVIVIVNKQTLLSSTENKDEVTQGGPVMQYTQEELVQRLKTNAVVYSNGLEKIEKGIPFQEGKKGLDPRVKQLILDEESTKLKKPIELADLEEIRSSGGFKNDDLSRGIRVEHKNIFQEDSTLRVRLYNRGEEKKPAIIYYHGGGFFEGDMDVVENPCKLLAQETGAVVISVEYRLAPEFPYAAGLTNCLEAVRYVYEFADELSIDRDTIALVGDSVGGNLALGVNHLSSGEPWTISYLGLLYPLVDLSDFSGEKWNTSAYDFSEDEALIRRELINMRQSLFFIQSLYLNDLEQAMSPLVSPVLSEVKQNIPPVTIVTAEFDYLKIQGAEFARQMADASVPVRHIEYKGMDHAFVEKLGWYPQAADAITEISRHFKENI